MAQVFLSYRHDDAPWATRALADALRLRFGSDQIFHDVNQIEPGEDFVEAIRRNVESCEVLLAVTS